MLILRKLLPVTLALAMATPLTYALDPDILYWQYGRVFPPEETRLDYGVNAVAQTPDGYLWLATDRGLARFDGLDVELYRASMHPGLISSVPTDLWVDRDGRLHIISQQGMSRLDGQRFVNVLQGNKTTADILAIAQDARGHIWLGNRDGLWRWSDNRFEQRFADVLGTVTALLAHGDDTIVGSEGELFRLTAGELESVEMPAGFEDQTIRDLASIGDTVYAITQHGLLAVTGDRANALSDPLVDDAGASGLYADRDGNLWFYGESGFSRRRPDGTFEPGEEVDDTFGLSVSINDMLEDRNGTLWTADSYFGLIGMVEQPARRVAFYEGLQSPLAMAVTMDAEGRIYVATPRGVDVIEGQEVRALVSDERFETERAQTMLIDDAGRLLVGTTAGLRAFDVSTGQSLPMSYRDRAAVNALAVAPDGSGHVWVGTDRGLHEWRGAEQRTILATVGVAIEALFYDRDGTLWLGTENGLASLGEDTVNLHVGETAATVDAVDAITQLDSGAIVAATRSHGLIVQRGVQWQGLWERHGLPGEKIFDLEVRDGQLLLLTNAGLFRVSQDKLQHNKVQPVSIMGHTYYRPRHPQFCCRGDNASDGVLFNNTLVTTAGEGVLIVDLDRVDRHAAPPAPYVRRINVDGFDVPVDDAISMTRNTRQIRIDYSALSLGHNGRTRFRYRLIGLSDEWIDMGVTRSVRLTALPPGDFRVDVQASLLPGEWSEATASLNVRRVAHFTETDGYRVVLWLLSALAILALSWLRSRLRQ
ncbi:MAG: two-component regulator propeller domain-containing protein, partial [Pseudomonadota bacterium]